MSQGRGLILSIVGAPGAREQADYRPGSAPGLMQLPAPLLWHCPVFVRAVCPHRVRFGPVQFPCLCPASHALRWAELWNVTPVASPDSRAKRKPGADHHIVLGLRAKADVVEGRSRNHRA